jgi:hypothetical protein
LCHLATFIVYNSLFFDHDVTDDELLEQLSESCEDKKSPNEKTECKAFMDKNGKNIIKYARVQSSSIAEICQEKLQVCPKPKFENYY